MAGDIANLGAAAPLMQDQYAGAKSMPSAVKSKPKAKAKKKAAKKPGATKPNPFAKKANPMQAPAPSPIAQAMGAKC